MLAMDVVDTLRHREDIVARELDAAGRRARLIDRLRDIYAAQGIEVTDAILKEGVRALEEDRFKYQPPEPSFRLRLARFYVSRDVWMKPFIVLGSIALILFGGYFATVTLPEQRALAALPGELDNAFAQIVNVANDRTATDRAQTLLADARAALDEGDADGARALEDELSALLTNLRSEYELRIVSRPNELSGVWRVPAVNSSARNHYLIVEAIDTGGKRLRLPIRSEEDGKVKTVSKWGLRVSERTFQQVAADKRDDGIIQGALVGRKPRGDLDPEYLVPTSGATITDW